MKPTLALIISKQDTLQNGLLALLTTIPQINAVLAEDATSGLKMLKDHRPSLILLDMDLPEDDAQTILKQIKSQASEVHCIALADNAQQKYLAETHKADAVLFKGFQATSLINLIEELMSEKSSRSVRPIKDAIETSN